MGRARQPGCRTPIPTPKTWVIRAEYRGGNWPSTRNPAGGADGVWFGSVGGSLPKLAIGHRGSGGRAVHLAINHLVAPRSQEVQPAGDAGGGSSGVRKTH
jgi:hypothetical protein